MSPFPLSAVATLVGADAIGRLERRLVFLAEPDVLAIKPATVRLSASMTWLARPPCVCPLAKMLTDPRIERRDIDRTLFGGPFLPARQTTSQPHAVSITILAGLCDSALEVAVETAPLAHQNGISSVSFDFFPLINAFGLAGSSTHACSTDPFSSRT